jgi:uncharacterized protein (DUF4415 family)
MQRKGSFVHYTADELSKLKSETDWAKVDATTREEVERQAEADDGPLPEGWEDTVVLGVPGPKRGVYLRLDPDVLDWFKANGRGYQTRINAVLRAFVRARKEREHSEKLSPPNFEEEMEEKAKGDERSESPTLRASLSWASQDSHITRSVLEEPPPAPSRPTGREDIHQSNVVIFPKRAA